MKEADGGMRGRNVQRAASTRSVTRTGLWSDDLTATAVASTTVEAAHQHVVDGVPEKRGAAVVGEPYLGELERRNRGAQGGHAAVAPCVEVAGEHDGPDVRRERRDQAARAARRRR